LAPACSHAALPDALLLQWTRKLPPQRPAWTDDGRAMFDRCYQPAAGGGMLFVASTVNDRLTAYDLAGGAEKWRFYAEGPIRTAPATWRDRLYVAADDGLLYCLRAADGSLLWKRRCCPRDRRLVGNERVISAWPCRGGPAVAPSPARPGRTDVYVAAGVFPFMGTFVCAYDAETGEPVWTGSDSSFVFRRMPHPGSWSWAGLSPQGNLAVAGDRLIAPGGIDSPGVFDRRTGRFLFFGDGVGTSVFGHGKFALCGGALFDAAEGRPVRLEGIRNFGHAVLTERAWYVAGAAYDPCSIELAPAIIKLPETVDPNGPTYDRAILAGTIRRLWTARTGTPWVAVNGRLVVTAGARGATRDRPRTAVQLLDVSDRAAEPKVVWETEIDGQVGDALGSDGRLVVVTLDGTIRCFGPDSRQAKTYESLRPYGPTPTAGAVEPAGPAGRAAALFGDSRGYCLIWGPDAPDTLARLARSSKAHVVAVGTRGAEAARRQLDEAGLYGTRAGVIAGDAADVEFAPYLAERVLLEDPQLGAMGEERLAGLLEKLYAVLRPYGGQALVWCGAAGRAAVEQAARRAELGPMGTRRQGDGGVLIERVGAPAGSADWLGQNADAGNTRCSRDELVKAPLGLLWFGNAMSNSLVLPRHGEGPVEQVAAGRLVIEGPDSLSCADVYTGRLLWTRELAGLGTYYNVTKHQRGAHALGSNYFAAPDAVYVAQGQRCLVLDPVTGRTTRELTLPGQAEWMFLLVYGDKLIAGMDPIVVARGSPGAMRYNTDASSRGLAVLDRRSGKVLWTRKADRSFGHYAVAAGAGKVFCYDRLSQETVDRLRRRGIDPNSAAANLLALDANSGEVVWQTDRCVGAGQGIAYSGEHDVVLGYGALRGRDGAVLWDKLTIRDVPDPNALGAGFATSVLGGVGRIWWGKWGPMINGRTIITQGQTAFDLLTGEQKTWTDANGQPRQWRYRRSHGCGPSAGARHIITFRSGCAGYYDLDRLGGTTNLGGFRSGCTSNLIVACGVLNAPDYTRTCTCAYQNRTSLGLVHDADVELWTYAAVPTIGRAGFNFGAPGDRVDEAGTLWRAEPPGVPPRFGGRRRCTIVPPPAGGPAPATRTFYNHSLLLGGEARRRWIAGSGIVGLRSVTLPLDELRGAKTIRLRLVFVEPEHASAGRRVFSAAIGGTSPNGKPAIEDLDVFKESGGKLRPLVKEFRNIQPPAGAAALELVFTPKVGQPLLCGAELLAAD